MDGAAEADGVIVVLTFQAPQRAGYYPITITTNSKDFVDNDLHPVAVETKAGAVTVECETHTEVVDEAIAATCTEPGLTEGKHCSVCRKILVAQETVAAKGPYGSDRPGGRTDLHEAGQDGGQALLRL